MCSEYLSMLRNVTKLNICLFLISEYGYNRKSVSTATIINRFSNIPESTIYRYVKELTTDNLIIVSKTEKSRGATKKFYTVSSDFIQSESALSLYDDYLDIEIIESQFKLLIDKFKKWSLIKPFHSELYIEALSIMPLNLSTNQLQNMTNDLEILFKKYHKLSHPSNGISYIFSLGIVPNI